MKTKRNALLFALLLTALTSLTALGQVGGVFDLSWLAFAGGGASSGGGYTLAGAIGQAEGGSMAGGAYHLSSGFGAGSGQPSGVPPGRSIYLPLVTVN